LGKVLSESVVELTEVARELGPLVSDIGVVAGIGATREVAVVLPHALMCELGGTEPGLSGTLAPLAGVAKAPAQHLQHAHVACLCEGLPTDGGGNMERVCPACSLMRCCLTGLHLRQHLKKFTRM